MNRAQLGLWSAIAGIFLLAILGIRSAANWLTQSTPADPANPTLTVTENQANGSRANGDLAELDSTLETGTRAEDRIVARRESLPTADRDSGRINAQTDGQSEQPTTAPTSTLTFSPLEEAGTYIQRQKRVERDSFVAATNVDAVPVTNDTATATQNDSRVTQPTPTSVTDNQPSQARPATSDSPAVPALW